MVFSNFPKPAFIPLIDSHSSICGLCIFVVLVFVATSGHQRNLGSRKAISTRSIKHDRMVQLSFLISYLMRKLCHHNASVNTFLASLRGTQELPESRVARSIILLSHISYSCILLGYQLFYRLARRTSLAGRAFGCYAGMG